MKTRIRLGGIALLAAISFAAVTPAAAEETDSAAVDAVEAIETIAPSVLQDTLPATDPGSVTLPETSAADIELLSDAGKSLNASLPFSDNAAPLAAIDGTAVFDNANGSLTVPAVKTDGSVQITTVINDSAAPIEYETDFSSNGDVTLTLLEGGIVRLSTGLDETIGWIAPPWATDAMGREVETSYEVRGTTLVQHVQHTTPAVSYPVVADPYLGQDLFSMTRQYTTDGRNQNVSMAKSSFGHAIHVAPGGQATFLSYGWREILAKRPIVGVRPTYSDQYDCHAVGGLFNLAGPTWDLEGHRSERSGWAAGVLTHRCNW